MLASKKVKPCKPCKTCDKNPRHPGRTECLVCIQKKEREKQKEKQKEQQLKKASRAKTQKAKATDKKRFSRSSLIREADRVHSLYTRWRDKGNPCITCNTPWQENFQCGHFMSRRHLNTRWLPTNAHGQCPKCNLYGAGEQYTHGQMIDRIYGQGTAEKIQTIANMSEKITDDEILHYIRKYYQELEEMYIPPAVIKKKKYYLKNELPQ